MIIFTYFMKKKTCLLPSIDNIIMYTHYTSANQSHNNKLKIYNKHASINRYVISNKKKFRSKAHYCYINEHNREKVSIISNLKFAY
jgi:hypothetical protein